MKKLVAFAAALLVGMAAAFVAGARVGVTEFLYADAQYKASILAYQLEALQAGRAALVMRQMETALDGELANHGKYMESWLAWLWPDLKAENDRAIRYAVDYRLANPHEQPDESKPESWAPGVDMNSAFVKETIEGQRAMNRYRENVLKYYAERR